MVHVAEVVGSAAVQDNAGQCRGTVNVIVRKWTKKRFHLAERIAKRKGGRQCAIEDFTYGSGRKSIDVTWKTAVYIDSVLHFFEAYLPINVYVIATGSLTSPVQTHLCISNRLHLSGPSQEPLPLQPEDNPSAHVGVETYASFMRLLKGGGVA